jgi:hypothetical protein
MATKRKPRPKPSVELLTAMLPPQLVWRFEPWTVEQILLPDEHIENYYDIVYGLALENRPGTILQWLKTEQQAYAILEEHRSRRLKTAALKRVASRTVYSRLRQAVADEGKVGRPSGMTALAEGWVVSEPSCRESVSSILKYVPEFDLAVVEGLGQSNAVITNPIGGQAMTALNEELAKLGEFLNQRAPVADKDSNAVEIQRADLLSAAESK